MRIVHIDDTEILSYGITYNSFKLSCEKKQLDTCSHSLLFNQYPHPDMTMMSPSTASVETSLAFADRSSLDPSLTPSDLVSARDSLATNMEQMDLRQSIIDDSKEWKGLYYAPTSAQRIGVDLESKRKTLERKVMDDMSHLTEAYNYHIASIQSISAKIPKYPKDIPRQLVEYLSQQSDVPTFENAVRETGLGGAFVELNWVLKQVKRGRELQRDSGTGEGETTDPEPDNGSVAAVQDGADSDDGNTPHQPRRVSGGGDHFAQSVDPYPRWANYDNYGQ